MDWINEYRESCEDLLSAYEENLNPDKIDLENCSSKNEEYLLFVAMLL